MKKESSVQAEVSPPKLGQDSALPHLSISKASVIFFALAFLLCGAIRFAWLSIDFGSLSEDPDAYATLAEGLASNGTIGHVVGGEVHATAYRPPGYIWALSWLVVDGQLSRILVSIFHGTLGVLTCILVARIAYLLTHSKAFAVFASLAVTVDPILLKQSSLVMTETLATFVAVALWWSWIELTKTPRSNSVMMPGMLAVGLLAGFGCLVRPTAFVWIALWFFVSMSLQGLVNLRRQPSKTCERASLKGLCATFCYDRHLAGWFCFFIGVATVVCPWAYRNSVQIGQWTMTTTHGGYTLLLANNPVLYSSIQKHGWDREWDETRFHFLWDQRRNSDPRIPEFWTENFPPGEANSKPNMNMDFQFGRPDEHREVADDRLASEVAWNTIQRDPGTFLKSCFVRISWFWAVFPYRSGAASVMVVAIGLGYSVLFTGTVITIVVLLFQRWNKGGPVQVCLEGTDPIENAIGAEATTVGQMASEAGACRSGQEKCVSSSLKAVGLPLCDLPTLSLWVPALSLVLSLQAVHFIYWSNMRMRAPLMPVLYIFFAVGVFFAVRSMRRGKFLVAPIPPSN